MKITKDVLVQGRKTLEIELESGVYHLRLTIAGQMKLKSKYKQEVLDIILSSTNDVEKMCAVFDEALSWKDNDNGGLNGEQFYDLLVDNEVKGVNSFAKVIFEIANASGLFNDEQTRTITEGISKTIDAAFSSILLEENELTELEEKDTSSFPKE